VQVVEAVEVHILLEVQAALEAVAQVVRHLPHLAQMELLILAAAVEVQLVTHLLVRTITVVPEVLVL
jgi:hypothetical protein